MKLKDRIRRHTGKQDKPDEHMITMVDFAAGYFRAKAESDRYFEQVARVMEGLSNALPDHMGVDPNDLMSRGARIQLLEAKLKDREERIELLHCHINRDDWFELIREKPEASEWFNGD